MLRVCILFAISHFIFDTAYSKPSNHNGYFFFIKVHFSSFKSNDTLYSAIVPTAVNSFYEDPTNDYILRKEFRSAVDKYGTAIIRGNMDRPYAYIFLSSEYNVKAAHYIPLFNLYLIHSGDSLDVSVDTVSGSGNSLSLRDKTKYMFFFTGKGAARFRWYSELNYPARAWGGGDKLLGGMPPLINEKGDINFNSYVCRIWTERLKGLERFRGLMTHKEMLICKADLLGLYFENLATYLYEYVGKDEKYGYWTSMQIRKLIYNYSSDIDQYSKGISVNFAMGAYKLESMAYSFLNQCISPAFYERIKDGYGGELRDKMMVLFLIQSDGLIGNENSLVMDALDCVKVSYSKMALNSLLARERGMLAYDFILPDENNRMVSLSSLRGKVVFVDFYFTGCSGCKGFYRDCLRDVEDTFENNADVQFVSISVDALRETWLSTLAKGGYSSFNKRNVLNLYTGGRGYKHPAIQHYNINGYPGLLLIDKSGRIFGFNDLTFNKKSTLIKDLNKLIEQPN